ncbi:hypothetical protein OBBRIDRAFT_602262 [Obba rivulosa]|uniref:Secreted protein n=1 Tax=Obba rivulosa TaxID=1052685 RepID=A0A8E2ASZ7_9APHY|nr:hypothetical protein OBBRIDRAFT_602262 [Obba rivulosa]
MCYSMTAHLPSPISHFPSLTASALLSLLAYGCQARFQGKRWISAPLGSRPCSHAMRLHVHVWAERSCPSATGICHLPLNDTHTGCLRTATRFRVAAWSQ